MLSSHMLVGMIQFFPVFGLFFFFLHLCTYAYTIMCVCDACYSTHYVWTASFQAAEGMAFNSQCSN